MPSSYRHEYSHNIPLKKDFDELYNSIGGGICYPKYPFKWSAFYNKDKIFDIEFTMEMQYYYSGGFELNKITNISIQKYVDKNKVFRALRDIIGSDKDIKDFYDVLCVESKSKNKILLYELFEDKAVQGRQICHTFIELYNKVMVMVV